MKRFHNIKGFLAGFLACAVLTATFAYADDLYQTITVQTGSAKIFIDGEQVDMESMLYDNRTYVPLRHFAGLLGKAVRYDSNVNEIHIDDKEAVQMMSKEVAFLVNGQPVRLNYFTQMINWYKLNSGIRELSGSQKNQFKEFVKNEVVKICVTQQFCEDLRITLSASDKTMIEDKINVFASNYGGLDKFTAELEKNGISYDVYYSLQEYYALRSKLMDVMTDLVSEDTIREYYDAHKDAYLVEKVKAKHILLKTTDEAGYPLPDSAKAKLKEKMNDILAEIKSGAKTFDEQMFKYSEDPGLKTNPDGYLFARGEFAKVFEDTAFSLKPGEMSPVFESELGYHIVYVVDKMTVYQPFESVKNDIYNIIRNDRYNAVMDEKAAQADIILNVSVYNGI